MGHFESYSKITLKELIKKIRSCINPRNLKWRIAQAPDTILEYVTQYNESYFSFLRRICAEQGQSFFYTGRQLQIGQQPSITEIALSVSDCHSFDLQTRIKPLRSKTYAYSYDKAKRMEVQADLLGTVMPLLSHVISRSKTVFNSIKESPSLSPTCSEAHLSTQTKIETDRNFSTLLGVGGKSSISKLAIGKPFTVSKKSENRDIRLGKYLITEIDHEYNAPGQYNNSFKAVPFQTPNIGAENIKRPSAQPQPAIVLETQDKDPLQIGRIKVKMLWQDAQTDNKIWLQVGLLWSGELRKETTFIPKVGDEVIVGFQHNNADLPYVMSSVVNRLRSKKIPASNMEFNMGSGTKLMFDDSEDIRKVGLSSGHNQIMLEGATNKVDVSANLDIMITAGPDSGITMSSAKVKVDCSGLLIEGPEGKTKVLLNTDRDIDVRVLDNYKIQANQIDQHAN